MNISRIIFSFIELLIKNAEGLKNWKPGTPSVDKAVISIFYISKHQDIANTIFKIIESLGFTPQRQRVHIEGSEKELLNQMLRVGGKSWASILIDPSEPNNIQIAHAFRNFAHKRPEVVAIVAGDRPNSVEVLDRYTHLKIEPESEPTHQETTRAMLVASFARVRHYKRIGRSAAILFTLSIIITFIIGSIVGWQFSHNRAEETLEKVRSFDAALIETYPSQNEKKEISVMASNRNDTLIKNSKATEFLLNNKENYSCKLLYIEFIDKLIKTNHKFGALCPMSRAHNGEKGYVNDNINSILSKLNITKEKFRKEFFPSLKTKLDEFLHPTRGKRAHLPTILFAKVDRSNHQYSSEKWEVNPGNAISKDNCVIIMAFEGSEIKVDGKTVFSVKRISRASTLRLCGIE